MVSNISRTIKDIKLNTVNEKVNIVDFFFLLMLDTDTSIFIIIIFIIIIVIY